MDLQKSMDSQVILLPDKSCAQCEAHVDGLASSFEIAAAPELLVFVNFLNQLAFIPAFPSLRVASSASTRSFEFRAARCIPLPFRMSQRRFPSSWAWADLKRGSTRIN